MHRKRADAEEIDVSDEEFGHEIEVALTVDAPTALGVLASRLATL